MTALPPPTEVDDDKLLVVATNDIEAILAATAIARQAEGPVTRIFLETHELGALAAIPAYRQGKARTAVLDFPTPLLARQPEEARAVLRIALGLTWVSGHPLDPVELDGLTRVDTVVVDDTLWTAAAAALDLAGETPTLHQDILAELPRVLPDPDNATPGLRWRYALEAARQEPLHLGPRTRGLVDLEEADPELVETGHELLRERRDLALTSSFHSFPTSNGTGVIVVAPQWSAGYYLDVVADLRIARGHRVSILAFDSQEPVIVEHSFPTPDLTAAIAQLRSTFPDHLVRPWRNHGFILKGPDTNDVALLQKLIDTVSSSA